MRYATARPDRSETRYLFLTGGSEHGPPEEVQVVELGGAQVHLADQDGADCTLAHVEVIAGPRPAVVSAVRVFSDDLRTMDQSQPGAMVIQVYRPMHGRDPGESQVVLRAAKTPTRSSALCTLSEVRDAMLRVAASVRK